MSSKVVGNGWRDRPNRNASQNKSVRSHLPKRIGSSPIPFQTLKGAIFSTTMMGAGEGRPDSLPPTNQPIYFNQRDVPACEPCTRGPRRRHSREPKTREPLPREMVSSGTLYHRKRAARALCTWKWSAQSLETQCIHNQLGPGRITLDNDSQLAVRLQNISTRQPHNRALRRKSSISGTMNLRRKTLN